MYLVVIITTSATTSIVSMLFEERHRHLPTFQHTHPSGYSTKQSNVTQKQKAEKKILTAAAMATPQPGRGVGAGAGGYTYPLD